MESSRFNVGDTMIHTPASDLVVSSSPHLQRSRGTRAFGGARKDSRTSGRWYDPTVDWPPVQRRTGHGELNEFGSEFGNE